jgi:WD40 repeat protein
MWLRRLPVEWVILAVVCAALGLFGAFVFLPGLIYSARHGRDIRALTLSPDGKYLLGRRTNGTLTLWDRAKGKRVAEVWGHTENVQSVAFSPDGRILATGGMDWTARLWDLPSMRERATLRVPSQYVEHVTFSPDGKTLYTGDFHGFNQAVRRWDVTTGKELAVVFKVDSPSGVDCLDLSPDGRLLASTGHDEEGTVQLWDLAAGKRLAVLNSAEPGHRMQTFDLRFTPDGKFLVTQGGESDRRELLVWDVAGRKVMKSLGPREDLGHMGGLTIMPDSRTLLAFDYMRWDDPTTTMRRWDLVTGESLAPVKERTRAFKGFCLSEDGTTAAGYDLVDGRETIRIVPLRDLFPGLDSPTSRR